MKKLTTLIEALLCTLLLAPTVWGQLSGTYYIGSTGTKPGGGDPDYLTLRAAINALNNNGINNDVAFYFTSDITEPATCQLGVNTAGHTITFKPYSTLTSCTITFNKNANLSGNAWFGLWVIGTKDTTTTGYVTSTNNIVIDGSKTVNGTTRDLNIVTTSTTASGCYPFRIAGACDNVTIKNCNITTGYTGGSSTYGIRISSKYTAAAADSVPTNILIKNNNITNIGGGAGHGILIDGNAAQTVFSSGVVIRDNIIVAKTRGIFLNNCGSTDIYNNIFRVKQTGSGFLSYGVFGLAVGPSSTINIYNNVFDTLLTFQGTTAGSNGIVGILCGATATWNVFNNILANIYTTTASADPNLPNIFGIQVTAGTANIFYNTINMTDLAYDPTGNTRPQKYAGILVSGGTATIKNNAIIGNEPNDSSYTIYHSGGTIISNYNDLYQVNAAGYVGFEAGAAQTSLANWRTASSQDANSKSGAASFVSATNFHINPNANPISIVFNAGTPIAGITTDIDGDIRDATSPDIGADEYTPLLGIAASTSKTVSFGNVTVGLNKVDNSVSISNIGGVTLNISSIASNDAQVTVSPTSATLAPGANQALQITYTPTTGSTIAGAIVLTSDGASTSDTIAISGTGVLPSLNLSSTTMSFGTVIQSVSKKDSATVTNNGLGDLLISSVASTNADFVVTPNGANTITPGNSAKYYVTFTPSSLGSKSGYVVFNHNNITKPKDSIAVDGVGSLPGFGLSATSKDIGNVRKGKSKADSVVVSNSGIVAINISSVASDNAEFVVAPTSVAVQPSGSQAFVITLTPTALGVRTSNIVFTHDGSYMDTVKAKGTGVFPAFAIRSNVLNQGEVRIGKSKTDSIYILNTGTDTLHVDSLHQNRSEFAALAGGGQNYITVAPADSKKVYIKFSPTVLGTLKDTLVVYHDGPSLRDTIFVSGNGGIPVFAVDHKSISYGSVVAHATKKDSVVVTNSGLIELKIDSVKSDNGIFTATPSSAVIAPSGTTKFYLSFTPTSPGAKTGNMVFYHDALSIRDTVSVSGTSVQATFSASTKTLPVGSAIVNSFRKDSVTVTNSGTSQLVISSVTSTNTEFTVSLTSATLDTSAAQRFIVTFNPSAAGVRSGNIVFNHNGGSISDTVAVSGLGVAITSIKAARLAPNGTDVAFIGTVTRAKGSYTYMQDDSAGIIIFQSSGAYHDTLANGWIKKGDKVRILGKTSEFNSLKEIAGTDLVGFTIGSHGNPLPAPKVLTLKQVATGGENYESQLIRVPSLSIVTTDSVFAAAKTYTITDPSDTSKAVALRTPNATDGDVDGLVILKKLVTFTGVLGQFNSSNPAAGYQLMAIDSADILDNVLIVIDPMDLVPTEYQLAQNYPNPFNPSTTVQYGLPKQSKVTVKIYSILGQEVKTLVNDLQSPSYYRVIWNGTDNSNRYVSTGVYFVRITAEATEAGSKPFVQVKKMLMIK